VRTVGFPVNRLIVQSFWPLSLDQVHTRNPRIRTLFLTTATLPGAPPGVGFPATTNVTFSTARGYDISAPDVASIDMGPALVRLAHGLGREIVVWTPDTKAQIRASIADGVDGIISNRPDLVYALR
jgi:glycerophosphoryl diester phosphodiesterase